MNEQEEKSVFPPEEPDFEDPKFNWEEWDKLGFKGVAENIVTDIEAFGTPLIYGVYGRWGSGKTSMMRAIQDCLKARNGYKTVWFDPWWYDHADKEQLFLGLLRKIEKEIAPQDNTTLTEIGVKFTAGAIAALRLVVDAGTSLLGIGKVTEDAKKFYKEALELIEGEQKKQIDAVEETRTNLCKAIDSLLKKDETLILVVDDLDRCLPDRAILLLDQLKNFLYLSRVVTVLGIDDEVFANMLNIHYQYHWGHQYLDKIIRHAYRLGKGTIEKCLATYLPYSDWLRRNENMYFLRALANLWSMTGEINPRIVHRTMTTFLQIIKIRPLESMSFGFKHPTGFFEGNMRKEWLSFLTKMNGMIPLPVSDSGGEFVKFTEDQCFGVCLWYTIALSKRFQLPLIQDKGGVLPLLLDPTEGFIPLWVVNRIYEIFKTWF
ncbi:hypothetical protein CEE36_05755 [candidate division TA06 bacterium B3_TA06]|uniref:KAP NTPase domain-containing protein n=1 Tax=candidate division TA06 bacterium B3_TA06 TaxID=2012487 RepID=A0A532V725_UNCT6|nr:MAG: hypothetical protein CEE36_05755 [candidate division TA06 bacterium B3_TA06]